MRVLLCSPSMEVGGAERVVAMLASALAARGVQVAVAAPAGVRDEDLREVPHTRLALDDHGRGGAGAMRTAWQLAGAVRAFDPDVVHAQNVKSTAIARAAVTLARPRARSSRGGHRHRRAPVLATFHGVTPSEYRRAALLLRAADHVVCVSGDLRDRIVAAGLPARRTSLIRNAVALAPPLDAGTRARLDRELGLDEAPVVAIVGRLVAQKAHERFIRAMAVALKDAPSGTQALIVGDGPRRQELEGLVQAAGLTGRIRFAGSRTDSLEVIARADVVAFSSNWEGLSIAALEALAAGTPVVSTDVQGMRELLAGGAGAVVALDDGEALGHRIAELLRDPHERARMGRAGRALIEREFALEAMVDAYARLYRQLAALAPEDPSPAPGEPRHSPDTAAPAPGD